MKQKDVVGNIIQEWLQGWMVKRGIELSLSHNTQMPPDFFLNPEDETTGLLEVKAFNRHAYPGFDIADFQMYAEEIIEKPYMLYVEYLIFGYSMSEEGIVTIDDLWCKKGWKITRSMPSWPLNIQVKKGVVHKIRPGVWFSTKPGNMPMSESLEDFVCALEETVYRNPKTRDRSGQWKNRFLQSYRTFYGERLSIPRWEDIEEKYRGE